MNSNKESEGEELIAEFLEEKDIKFKKQVKITNLREDVYPSRIADFYLPQVSKDGPGVGVECRVVG